MLKIRIGPDSDDRERALKHIRHVLVRTRSGQLPGVDQSIAWGRTRCDYCPTMIWSRGDSPMDLCEKCAKEQEQESLAGVSISLDTLPEEKKEPAPVTVETTLVVPPKNNVLH